MVFLEIAFLYRNVFLTASFQRRALGVPVYRTYPLVGTGLGDRVDTGSDKCAVAHVVRGDHHLDLIDGFQRDRLKVAGTQFAGQTVRVVERSPVHRDVVETVAGSGKAVPVGHGSQAGKVIDRAVDGRHPVDLVARDDLLSPGTSSADDRVSSPHHNDFTQILGIFFENHIEIPVFSQNQIYVFDLFRGKTHERNLDRVRPAYTHTVDVETAIGLCSDHVNGSRRKVRSFYSRSGHRFFLRIGNQSADARSCHLRRCPESNRHESDNKCKTSQECFHKVGVIVGIYNFSSGSVKVSPSFYQNLPFPLPKC